MENGVKSEYTYEAPKGKVWKTDGNCEEVLVDDHDCFDWEGNKRKVRKKNTHLTPKKKKRKN
jgi:hypothetical protein